jgi:hypothetical protein
MRGRCARATTPLGLRVGVGAADHLIADRDDIFDRGCAGQPQQLRVAERRALEGRDLQRSPEASASATKVRSVEQNRIARPPRRIAEARNQGMLAAADVANGGGNTGSISRFQGASSEA